MYAVSFLYVFNDAGWLGKFVSLNGHRNSGRYSTVVRIVAMTGVGVRFCLSDHETQSIAVHDVIPDHVV